MKTLPLILFTVLLSSCFTFSKKEEVVERLAPIVRYDRSDAAILKGVFIPEGKSYYLTSGLVATAKNPDAVPGTYERYGNTYEQSISILEKIKATLQEAGFEMHDVVFLRVYLAPDKEGKIDWDSWFKAYGEYFNNDQNPNKVARSTIGVYALANPDLLVEIEAVAAK
jgi:enamine deaminase RidA (YjgF/YER057c/UK114 family)